MDYVIDNCVRHFDITQTQKWPLNHFKIVLGIYVCCFDRNLHHATEIPAMSKSGFLKKCPIWGFDIKPTICILGVDLLF